ncbi:MAG TPA: hypothetical protein DIV79_14545 [Opitutae bacterium]|nr:hypothetical protein [Opitutaceae bacterium]HCR31226.1 hypothetical protein [Opitutae bacterium]|tara:strand:+ start:601 stop:864 length:264 start_codon:yes stop_codon:yes gene_type:complete
MFRFLSNLLHKRRVRNDALLDRSSDDFRMQNAQFVSFLQKSGFRYHQLNRHDKSKRLKKLVSALVACSLVVGLIWVVVESAQALELF